jgi:hypothetical protein
LHLKCDLLALQKSLSNSNLYRYTGVRNRTVRLNLQATITTLALTVTAVPASLAGMNIPNGFEESHPMLFWGMTGTLGAISAGTWVFFMRTYKSGSGLSGSRVDDLRALRFVLQRMDELDDVMRAKGGGGGSADAGAGVRSKDELVQALREVEMYPSGSAGGASAVAGAGRGGGSLGGGGGGGGEGGGGGGGGGAHGKLGLVAQVNELDPSALDLIFKVFDRDGDGRIDPSQEWIIRPYPREDGKKRHRK